LLEHKRVDSNATHDGQHLLLQQKFSVVFAWLQLSFETGTETISDLENAGL